MRKIIIYSTKGKGGSIETDATTWGEIRDQVADIVGDLSNLKATENQNKTTLEHIDSKLPEGNFTIFLRPEKNKLGNDFLRMSFSELRNYIKEEGKPAKDFLNEKAKKEGRNWTQLSTLELQTFLSEYVDNSGWVDFEENDDEEVLGDNEFKTMLEGMDRDELVDFINDNDLDIDDWKPKTKEELIDDILNSDVNPSEIKEKDNFDELQAEFEDLEEGFI